MNFELSGDLVIVREGNIAKIHEKSHYGNMTEDGLQLSLIEDLYLMEKGKLEIHIDSDDVTIEKLYNIIRKQENLLLTTLCSKIFVTGVILLRLVSNMGRNLGYMKEVNLQEMVIPTIGKGCH